MVMNTHVKLPVAHCELSDPEQTRRRLSRGGGQHTRVERYPPARTGKVTWTHVKNASLLNSVMQVPFMCYMYKRQLGNIIKPLYFGGVIKSAIPRYLEKMAKVCFQPHKNEYWYTWQSVSSQNITQMVKT